MWVLWWALTAAVLSPAHTIVFSSRRTKSKRMDGAQVAETLQWVKRPQCQMACHQRGDCRSINYNPTSRVCELLTNTVCDHSSYYLTANSDWDWFDIVDPVGQSSQWLWSKSACRSAGRCRESCLRRLDEMCRETDQCDYHVTGTTTCSSNKCQCHSSFWQYNSTLCIRREQTLRTDGEHWVWKKITNDVCSLEFDAIAADDLRFVLAESYTHYSNRYHLRIGYSGNRNSYAERVQHGVKTDNFASYDGEVLDSSNWRGYWIHWCSGRIRFDRTGVTTLFDWQDAARFTPKYIGLWTTYEGRWRFKTNVVDPWMEEWSSDRIYQLPRRVLLHDDTDGFDFTNTLKGCIAGVLPAFAPSKRLFSESHAPKALKSYGPGCNNLAAC